MRDSISELKRIMDTINDTIDKTKGDSDYDVGLRNGMRYSLSVVLGKEPKYEEVKSRTSSGKEEE